MVNPVVKAPVVFCPIVPTYADNLTIRMPFGLPPIFASASLDMKVNTKCQQLESLFGQLNVSMAAFLPIIKICACLLKIVEVLKAVPDVVSNPGKVTSKLSDLEDCIDLFIGYSFVVPIPLCRFVLDLVTAMISLLLCISSLLVVTLDNDNEIASLNASADLQLNDMGACLQVENNALKASLEKKLKTVELVIFLVNALIAACPPLLVQMGTEYPINVGNTDLTPAFITSAINKLDKARDPLAACAGTPKKDLSELLWTRSPSLMTYWCKSGRRSVKAPCRRSCSTRVLET